MHVEAGRQVGFHYVLRGEDGEVLDDSRARGQEMSYVHGAGELVVGLERALEGREAGDRLDVVVPPEEAYGTRRGEPMPVPRSAFPEDAALEVGASFGTRSPDGRPMMLWITSVSEEEVWVDPHHPLAGRTLRFEVEVLSVADPEEV
jgi:FKBP-type peptidyl-prolyl cis-trans isomerase SlyD